MKRMLCITLAIMLIAATVAVALGEKPTPEQILAEHGIMVGDGDGNLRSNDPVSRAEMAKMIAVELDLRIAGTTEFTDLPADHWAQPYVTAAASLGAISGFPDGSFRPDAPVTYEDAVKMTLAACGEHHAYPLGYLSTAMERGLLDGIPAVAGRFATRGDVATFLLNLLTWQQGQKSDDTHRLQNKSSNFGMVSMAPAAVMQDAAAVESTSAISGGGGSSAGYLFPYEPEIIHNTEEYTRDPENRFKEAGLSPLSTFSIDVDTASYSNMRRFLSNGSLPQLGAVRTEELINYFEYDYPVPTDGSPVAVSTELGVCPWNTDHRLAMIRLRGGQPSGAVRQNLVFLLDVSGSMYADNKLPLVKKAMELLVTQLTSEDTVSIVTYASGTGVVLDGARGDEPEHILEAISSLQAGGSTAGAAGITLAYETAAKHFVEGNNRIILCTDGDFNVGVSSTAELEHLVAEKRKGGVFLSVLGFGMGNYKDNRMETLADKGNGNYAYIDNEREARKVLVQDMTKTLHTVAKDVKLQVEFNPQYVSQYRLVGYENRMLETEDFADDTKDAGELGAGQTVTAFYEIIPANGGEAASLRYQERDTVTSDELMCVSVRYKMPDGEESILSEFPVQNTATGEESEDFRFASAVAAFGMFLNESQYLNGWHLDQILTRAESAVGKDPYFLRNEFIQLVGMAGYLERQ